MTTITTTDIAAINQHHRLACDSADEAINHAAEAGKLLLKAKAAIAYGEWLGWLDANVDVTARQAQRYIRVAQGKPLPLRAITKAALPAKETTPVSHLQTDWTPRPKFIPLAGHWYWCAGPDGGMAFVIEPSAQHPGFFFASHLHSGGDEYDATNRPVRADWIEDTFKHFGLQDPANADWHVRPSAGVSVALETLNAVEVVA